MELYDDVSYKVSKLLTNKYSTSFSLGIKAFTPEYREPIYAIYGFVRLADEIVDTFHDHDKKYLLDQLRKETFEAINRKISIIKNDSHETQKGTLLKYGHTIGNAIEFVSKGQIKHGEGVAFGLLVSAEISYKLNLIEAYYLYLLYKNQKKVLNQFYLF